MRTIDFIKIMEVIASRFRGRVEQVENHISLFIGNCEYFDEITDINNVLVNISSMTKNNVAMFNSTMYEIALDRRLNIIRFIDRNDIGTIEDCDNKIKYKVGVASLEYIVWMLSSLNEKDILKLRDLNIMNSSMASDRFNSSDNIKGSLLEFLGEILSNTITLKIQCAENKSEEQYEQLFDAFRFQIANNYNDVIMPINDFQDLCMKIGVRRSVNSINQITAPRRIYMKELTNQYYMGMSSKLPFVEFVCYYHVMEYFFEKVYNDEIIKSLQDRISSPRFSVKREQDIKDVIKFVTKKVHDKNERYDINELEALELVLKKYVDITEMVKTLPHHTIDYYRTTEVPFSKGDIVDIHDVTDSKIYKRIAARIYKTRNSIVHSKSGEKAVYSPFRDDEALEKEIPLLRYIAEEIIIGTSRLM